MDRTAINTILPRQATDLRVAAGTRAGAEASARSLPPTRAARPARSRGVFLAGSGERGLVRGAVSLLCVALTALSLVAVAPRLLDAPVVADSSTLELVATSAQLPAELCPTTD
jgi:hypothetical protein